MSLVSSSQIIYPSAVIYFLTLSGQLSVGVEVYLEPVDVRACFCCSIASGRTLGTEILVPVEHEIDIARSKFMLDVLFEVHNKVADCPIRWPVYHPEDS